MSQDHSGRSRDHSSRTRNLGAGGGRNRARITAARFTAQASLAGSWGYSRVDKGRHVSLRAMGGDCEGVSAGGSGLDWSDELLVAGSRCGLWDERAFATN